MNRFFKPKLRLFLILVLFTISFCIGLTRLSPIFAAAGINQVINFQGKVVNTDGTNVTDGLYDFVFKMYDGAASGSTALFTETWSSAALFSSTMSSAPASGGESLTYSSNTNESTLKVGQILWNVTKVESVVITSVNTGTNVLGISPTIQAWAASDTITNKIYVKDGVFHVGINSLNQDLSGVDFNSDTIFLGLNFNGNGEMKPRIQYTSVPYALNAQKVSGLTVTNTTGTFTLTSGKTLTVNNTLSFSGTDGTGFTFPSSSGIVVTNDSTSILTNKTIGSTGLTFSGASTDITTGTDENLAIMPNGSGNVGINTTSPVAKLHVVGDNTYSALFMSGNVGIGTTAPAYKLEVSGDIHLADSGPSISRLILGTSGTSPTGVNGAMYYDSSAAKFKCYQNGAWTNCIGSGSGTPDGANGLVQFNNGGSFGGASQLYYNNSTNMLGIGFTNPTVRLHVVGDGTYAAAFMNGNVGIGTSSPSALFAVGSGSQFTVNSSGAITAATGITSSGTYNLSSLGTGLVKSTAGVLGVATSGVDYMPGMTFTNGLTLTGNTVTLGGTLTQATSIINGGNNFSISGTGNVGIGTSSPTSYLHIVQNVITSGAPTALTLVGGAHTTLDASSEVTDVNFNLARAVQFKSGTLATERAINFQAPTYTFNGISTISNASLFNLTGAPIAGTNATITNASVLKIAPGSVITGAGQVQNGFGLFVDAPTSATNNYAATFASGNVGIGTTTPSTTLYVSGTATISSTTPTLVFNETDQQTWTWLLGTDQWLLQRAGADKLVINSGGSLIVKGDITNDASATVNMGATAASSTFNLKAGGTIGVQLLSNGNIAIGATNPSSPVEAVDIQGARANLTFSNGTGPHQIKTGGVTHLALMPGGNVGINTTAPSYKLEVNGDIKVGDSGPSISRLILGTSGTSPTGVDGAMYYDSAAAKFKCYENGAWTNCIGAGTSQSFTNGLTSTSNTVTLGGTLTQATTLISGGNNFNISGAGNVGIGHSNPLVKLHVVGDGTTAAAFMSGNVGIGTTSPAAKLHVEGTQSDSIQTIARFSANNSSAQSKVLDIRLTAGTPQILLTTAATGLDPLLSFSTAGAAAQMTMNLVGNVGIGTTGPSALFSVGATSQFQVNSTGGIAAATGITSSGTYNLSSLGTGLVKSTAGVLGVATSGSDYMPGMTFTNGLTVTGNTVTLGGTLASNTTLISGGNSFNIAGTGNVGIGHSNPLVKLHVVGNGTTAAAFMSGNVGIGTTSPTSLLDLVHTGAAFNGINLVANSLSTGIGLNLSSTSTALSTGGLLALDWSPTAATTATGDLFSLNIGSSGNVGNIFNIKDSGSSLFSVAENGITSAIPHAFTAIGDISMAYDLQFTNQTASYIKSNAPLYIQAGELFESNNLTLKTYNSGNIVLDAGASGGVLVNQEIATSGAPTALTLTGAAHTTLDASSEAEDVNFNLGRVVQFKSGALTTQRTISVAQPIYAFNGRSTLSNLSLLSLSGAPIAGTNATVTTAAALRISAGTAIGGTGSVVNGYGMYVDAPTGAANNYAATFATGNVGIGTTAPKAFLELSGASASTAHLLLTKTDNSFANPFTGMTFNLTGKEMAYISQAGSSGGTDLSGFTSDATLGAFYLQGHIGATTASSSIAAVNIRGWKLSGNNRAAMTGTELVAQIAAGSTPLVTVQAVGNVGIGITSPRYLTSILGTSTAGAIATITNLTTNTGTTPSVLRINTGAVSSSTGPRLIQFFAGSTTDNDGTGIGSIRVATGAVSYSTSGADFGEIFVINGEYTTGDIISVIGSGKQRAHQSEPLIGVVSDRTGFLGNSSEVGADKGATVGLLGQIKTKVSTVNGVIHQGDHITSSSIVGVGQKMTNAGYTIGRALEDFDPANGKGEVIDCPSGTASGVTCGQMMVLVNASWYDPRTFITSTGDVNGAQNSSVAEITTASNSETEGLVVADGSTSSKEIIDMLRVNSQKIQNSSKILTLYPDKLIAGLEIITPHISADLASVRTIESLDESGVALHLTQDGNFTITNASNEAVIKFDQEGNAFFNGLITAKGIKADQIEGIEFINKKIDDLERQIATPSAQPVATASATPEVVDSASSPASLDLLTASLSALLSEKATASPPIATDVASLNGLTVANDATISGQLHIAGSSLVEGVMNVIHTLTTTNFITTGWNDFMGSVIFRGSVAFTQHPTFSSDTAGTAVVKKGEDAVTVKFDHEYEDIPVINATISFSGEPKDKDSDKFETSLLSGNIRYIITKRSTKGFTIKLNRDATDNVEFSWIALVVQNHVDLSSLGSIIPTTIPTIPISSVTNPISSPALLKNMEH